MNRGPLRDRRWVRAGGVVLAFTVILTAAFMGVLGLIRGDVSGIGARVPAYSLVSAVTFVAVIYLFSRYGVDARTVLLSGVGFAAIAFVLFGLASEGVVYAIRFPGTVFGSQLVVYFLSAGMIVTGLGFWLITHWRELVGDPIRSATNPGE